MRALRLAAYSLPVRLLHHDGTQWIDVTSSSDAVTGTVCGIADELSPFAVTSATAAAVPDTAIESGPDASTPSPTAMFVFSATDANATFECALDDPAVFGSCDTVHEIDGLLPGTHELWVRAVNSLGIADATPASHRWTVTRPETTILTGPPISTVAVNASFTFSSDDELATYECALDGATFGSCENPHLLQGLLAGAHELLVRAKNDAGTVDATPASYRWTIRAIPDTALLERPADPTDSRTARFTFTSNMSGVTFECARDDAVEAMSFTPCSSPVTYTDMLYGEHDFAVRAVDADGNADPTPAEWGWDIEGIAPPVSILSAPNPTTESTTASFDFAAAGRELQYECALDGGAFSLCVAPKTYNGVPVGPHKFEVRVYVDEETQAEAEVTTYDWTVIEATPPETSIVWGPPAISYTNDPDGAGPLAEFALESDDPVATFQCALDAEPFTNCPDPTRYVGLAPGAHILRVRAVDLSGNIDASPASWNWTVVLDSTAPTTTIDHAETTAIEGEFLTTISFSANEAGATFECQIDSDPFEQCESPMEYSDLTPGQHRFRVRATDLALNVEQPPVSHEFSIGVDGVPPETTILSGPAATVPDDWATFELQSNEADARFECALDGEPFEECLNPAQFIELTPGGHTIRVRAVDSSLNPDPTPAVWTWTYQPVPATPETTIHSKPQPLSTSTTAVFTFSAVGAAVEFECALDAEEFESCENPYLIEELAPGVHIFQVRAVDAFLQTDETPASYTWRVVAPPLEPTIIDAPSDPSVGSSHTFAFTTTEPNGTFACRITPSPVQVNTFTPCSSPHTYNNLDDGEYIFEVIAVNEFGIAGEIPAEYSFEVANPPDTTILAGPSGTTDRTRDAFAFASSEPMSTFECSLDGEAFTECLSPAQFPDTEARLAGAEPRHPHVRGAGSRSERQHRPDAGQPHLDRRRADAPRNGDRRGAARDHGEHHRQLRLHLH